MKKKNAKEIIRSKFRKKLLEENLISIKRKSETYRRQNSEKIEISQRREFPSIADQFTLREVEIPSIDIYKTQTMLENNSQKRKLSKKSDSKTSLFNNSYQKKESTSFSKKVMPNLDSNANLEYKNSSLRNIQISQTSGNILMKRNSLSNTKRGEKDDSFGYGIDVQDEYDHFKESEKMKNIKKMKNTQNVNVNLSLNFKINQKISDIKTKVSNLNINDERERKVKKNKNDKNESEVEIDNNKNKKTISKLNSERNIIYPIDYSKNQKKHKEYYFQPLLNEINKYLDQNHKLEKTEFLKHFYENYTKFQFTHKLNIKNKNFIYPININLEYFSHKINSKKYIILDMDETLVFTSKKKINESSIPVNEKKNVF